MSGRRQTTEEERALFKEQIEEARPRLKTETAPARLRSDASAREIWSGGVDGKTSERMRRGLLEPEARLDLHGFTENAAHGTLLTFLKAAQVRGHKLVIVVTGKGAPVAGDEPFRMEYDRKPRGLLKTLVPRWLGEKEFAQFVAAARPAHRRHGGEGALYIHLARRRA